MADFDLNDFIAFVAEKAENDPEERYPLEFGPLHQFGIPDVTADDLKGVPLAVFHNVDARPTTWGGLHQRLLHLSEQ